MANYVYDKARQEFLDGDLDWSADTIKVILVDGNDVTVPVQGAADPRLSDVTTGIVGSAFTLTGKTSTAGVADGDNALFSTVSGDQAEWVIIYDDTHANDRLIAAIDTATGLPVTPGGGNITVTWDNGANKIFKL